MTDRAEAIAYARLLLELQPLDWLYKDADALPVFTKHLRALIAEPDERMVERAVKAAGEVKNFDGEPINTVLPKIDIEDMVRAVFSTMQEPVPR